ncbi:MAG: hypothetical protein K2L14_07835 [Duncaniella sp.]|nr:hypothetical protein [Duncaniella sp.]
MKDVIAIIVTILIGIGAKWLEDRHKNSGKKASSGRKSVGAPSRNDRYGQEAAYPGASGFASFQPQYTAPRKMEPEVTPQSDKEYKPRFEEGQCAVSHEPVEDIHAIDSSVDDEALSAHYARWRQAIIDAQIITPKFKD